MSTAAPPPTVQAQDGAEPGSRVGQRRRRRRVVAVVAAVAVVLAAAGVAVVVVRPFGIDVPDPFGHSGKPTSEAATKPGATATVKRGTLASQVTESGTLGYRARADGTPYSVVNQASGTYTRLPTAGSVIHCGDVLYQVSNDPVPLLCGPTPLSRSLSEGMNGPDVKELNAELVKLRYATSDELDPSSDYFGAATTDALENLQDDIGVDQTGSLRLGDAVFLPHALRVGKVTATPGTPARPGAPIAEATSTTRQVQVDLDASDQGSVKKGDKVDITLPDGSTTPGVVSRIGTVATSSGSGSGSDSSSVTIPVYIRLTHPKAAGTLDQAPVQVLITTDKVKDALIVPVTALLARAGGGYAVETVSADGGRQLVPVEVGLFDDADGLVQVQSPTLTAGQQVVVPAT